VTAADLFGGMKNQNGRIRPGEGLVGLGTTGIGTDQSWAALRQWGAATLTGREGL